MRPLVGSAVPVRELLPYMVEWWIFGGYIMSWKVWASGRRGVSALSLLYAFPYHFYPYLHLLG